MLPKFISCAAARRGYLLFIAVLSVCLDLTAGSPDRQLLHENISGASTHLQPIDSLPDTRRLNLTIGLPLRNKKALAKLLQEIYRPGSQMYQRYLSASEFTEQFGPTKEDYQALSDFAQSNNLQIVAKHSNRTLLQVSASIRDIRRVFHVNMRVYEHPRESRTFYCPDEDPSIGLDVKILGIKGLNDFNLPRRDGKNIFAKPEENVKPLAGSGPGGRYIGKDFRKAYAPGVTLTGAGQTAALVEFDGYYPSDIAAYESKAGLSAVPLTNVLIDGFNGQPGFQNDEVAVDTEMLVAMAPGLSRIVIYEENEFSPVDDMLNRIATDDAAAQISCSWLFITADAVTDQIFQQYAAQGQSFFCASGDFGALTPSNFGVPLGDPYITLVGGTVLSTSSGGAWQSEVAWNNSSGGFTTNYGIPSWQSNVDMSANLGSSTFRNMPDVSMCASNIFAIYNNGTSGGLMGTSCAAPLWAGFTALINQQSAFYGNGPVGFLNPAFYGMGTGPGYATNFHDITVGNNTNADSPDAYFAVAGYDLCTGWGTPNGSNLIKTLAPPDTLVMLPVPGFISSGPGGGPFNVTAESFLLTNGSAALLTWVLQSDAPWLSASPTNGTLSPGATVNVTVSLSADATNFLVGNYIGHVWLTNLSDGLLHHGTFALQISNQLVLSPQAGLEFAGPPSGPFVAAAQACQLSNASQNAVSWSIATNPPWLNVSPAGGVLGPYESVPVSVSLNSVATNLPAGSYSESIVFSNNTFASEENLPQLLLVGQLVQNGGFETGDLTNWTLTGNPGSTLVFTSSDVVHSGNYGVYFGQSGSMAYLSQDIPTVPGASYLISLWLDNSESLTTNQFSVTWGADTLCDFTNLSAIGWTNLQFTVLATNTNTVLAIGGLDDQAGLGLDDVSVTAAPPTVESVSPSRGPVTGGTTVLISGSGFQSLATVSFGSLPVASMTFDSSTTLTVVTPASSTVGPVNVTITNADGQIAVLTNGFLFVGTPIITWTNPAAITYGTALSAAQLAASANVPGTFSYVPPAGTVLNAGSNVLSAVFTPSDSVDYLSVTDYVGLAVSPAPLSVTASSASRPYGVTNPVFSGFISGLQNGDNITSLYDCVATAASPAGVYPIVPSLVDPNGRLTNYQVSIFDGTLMIQAAVPPLFQAAALSADVISFNWTSTVGASYQVQYNAVLSPTNWTDIGGLVVATNVTTSLTDLITNSQRFYRVLQVP